MAPTWWCGISPSCWAATVIEHPAFTTEPWCVRERHLHLDVLAQTGSVFALSNGHIGLRGNLDEGEPHGLPGTYPNSVYELRPLPHAEAGYDYPESGQILINVTNGKLIRLLSTTSRSTSATEPATSTSGCWTCGPGR
jgi:Glycosyl hydrolase family 65, N-terminal domain